MSLDSLSTARAGSRRALQDPAGGARSPRSSGMKTTWDSRIGTPYARPHLEQLIAPESFRSREPGTARPRAATPVADNNPNYMDNDRNSKKIWIGIDVSKAWLDIHCVAATGCLPKRLRNQVAELPRLLESLASLDGEPHVVFEASGGYERLLLDLLQANEVICSRVNPLHIRSFARAKGQLAKTDAIDAAVIADYGATICPVPSAPIAEDLEDLRALVQYRDHLNAELGRTRMLLEHRKPKALTTIIKRRINTLLANLKAIDREIDAHGKSSETIEAAANILVTTKGVGRLSALKLLAAMRPRSSH